MAPRVAASVGLTTLGCALLGSTAAADDAPPAVRFLVGAEASGAWSLPEDASFNRTDYDRDLLRLFRIRLSAELIVGSRTALVGELRSDDVDTPRVYALYLRTRPWRDRDFDVQLGLIPPVFGAYPRRRYASRDPLPGVPLVFHYLTTLRADVAARDADELVGRRASQASASGDAYGTRAYDHGAGLPFVSVERWDAGAQLRLGSRPVSLAAAVTQGSLSRPTVRDDNDGKQIAARLEWRPSAAWCIGASVARGEYATRDALAALEAPEHLHQTAGGADADFSTGHLIARAEVVWSRWDQPWAAADEPTSVTGLGGFVETRYKIAPGLTWAARAGHLEPSRVATRVGSSSWDAPVSRLETGLAFSVRRNVTLKAAYQSNWRDTDMGGRQDLATGQIVVWY